MAKSATWIAIAVVAATCAAVAQPSAGQPVVLERLSQTYMPFEVAPDGTPVFCIGEGGAEQIAFEPAAAVLYASGDKIVRAFDVSDPANPVSFATVDVPGEVTDVAVCGSFVAATMPREDASALPGLLQIFSTLDPSSDSEFQLLGEIEIGAVPDALVFTPDCSMILVANEAEAGLDGDGMFLNPEGSVTIFPTKSLKTGETVPKKELQKSAKTIGFEFLNENPEKYTKKGVRWVWRGQALEEGADTQTFSKDIEPEQVIVTADGKKAFVNLQENNAVAILDLEKMKITSVESYGVKDFSKPGNEADFIEDGTPSLESWPLFGFYQPDVITTFNHEGENFIVTANEGDVKEYNPEDQNITEWNEFMTGTEFVNFTEPPISEDVVAALADESQLGSLEISRVDGISGMTDDGQPIFNKLFTYGGRSWSIFREDDLSLVYDSGDDFERVLGEFFPWTFNSDEPDSFCTPTPGPDAEPSDVDLEETLMDPEELAALIDQANIDLADFEASPDAEAAGLEEPTTALTTKPEDLADTRSSDRGPEPEAVLVGSMGDRRLLIVTVEKGSSLFVYDISDPFKPVWQSAIYPGAHGETWAELYNRRAMIDLDPEGLVFVKAEDSPTGDPLLMVSGAESGTISIYKVTTMDVTENCTDQVPMFDDDGTRAIVVSTSTTCVDN